jgi:hypothetical protein
VEFVGTLLGWAETIDGLISSDAGMTHERKTATCAHRACTQITIPTGGQWVLV